MQPGCIVLDNQEPRRTRKQTEENNAHTNYHVSSSPSCWLWPLTFLIAASNTPSRQYFRKSPIAPKYSHSDLKYMNYLLAYPNSLVGTVDAYFLLQFILKHSRNLLGTVSSSHDSICKTTTNLGHHPTDKMMGWIFRAFQTRGVRHRYRHGPLLRHGFLEWTYLSDEMGDLQCKVWHHAAIPDMICKYGSGAGEGRHTILCCKRKVS